MTTFLTIIIYVSIGGAVFSLFMLLRNQRVFEERMRILEMIRETTERMINSGIGNWERLYKDFDSISHEKMLYQFWKPVKSFYDEDKFRS